MCLGSELLAQSLGLTHAPRTQARPGHPTTTVRVRRALPVAMTAQVALLSALCSFKVPRSDELLLLTWSAPMPPSDLCIAMQAIHKIELRLMAGGSCVFLKWISHVCLYTPHHEIGSVSENRKRSTSSCPSSRIVSTSTKLLASLKDPNVACTALVAFSARHDLGGGVQQHVLQHGRSHRQPPPSATRPRRSVGRHRPAWTWIWITPAALTPSKKPFYVYFRILHAYTIIYLKYRVYCCPHTSPRSQGDPHLV